MIFHKNVFFFKTSCIHYLVGLCMVYVQSKYVLDGYNCATFDEGCPDVQYLSDETYLCKTYNELVAIICLKKVK